MTRPLPCRYRQLPCAGCVTHGCRTPYDRAQRHAEQDAARVWRVTGWITAAGGLVIIVAALAWSPVWWATLPGLALGAGALWVGWWWAR